MWGRPAVGVGTGVGGTAVVVATALGLEAVTVGSGTAVAGATVGATVGLDVGVDGPGGLAHAFSKLLAKPPKPNAVSRPTNLLRLSSDTYCSPY
jgi:hypothetical protein